MINLFKKAIGKIRGIFTEGEFNKYYAPPDEKDPLKDVALNIKCEDPTVLHKQTVEDMEERLSIYRDVELNEGRGGHARWRNKYVMEKRLDRLEKKIKERSRKGWLDRLKKEKLYYNGVPQDDSRKLELLCMDMAQISRELRFLKEDFKGLKVAK